MLALSFFSNELKDVILKCSADMYRKYLKILFDIVIALLSLVILSPLMLLISILILIYMGYPIMFRQERPGLKAKTFKIFKFRTMSFDKDSNNQLLPAEMRLTGLGKLLRKTSLDELPELINILKCDMSFVGPRPLLVKYLPYYSDLQRRRHLVRPGLTGLAQVNGRNSISWEDKFTYDVWYVDHLSFKLDLKIIVITILKVVKSEGINSTLDQLVVPFDEYIKNK
jgi:undecaprenyl phosphate N,N'-diacetylbacillosamine 1-phosphate transferase